MIFRFENCSLDAERRELRRSGILCPLEPQIFDLLEFLIRNRERVVSRDDLLSAVWRGRAVSDAALDTRISTARQAIGDSGSEQCLIRTLRSVGFRFIGSVREEGWPKRAALSRALSAGHPTIAVVPFANLNGVFSQNSFADGVTEALITALSKVDWLVVASRASSFSCKGQAIGTTQIANKLGVRYLLEGSIRQMAGRQRVTVQLVDAIADHQMWTDQYDQDVRDGFKFEDEVCGKVVGAIEPLLFLAEHLHVQRKPAVNFNAWECLVRAVSLMNSREEKNVAAAHALIKQAIAIDPKSAQIRSLLSMVMTLRVHMGWADRQIVIPGALAAAAGKALALNSDEPWAHAAIGYASIWKQPQEAIAPCQRAIALNPNFAVGHYFLAIASVFAGYYDHVFADADTAERFARRDFLSHCYAGAPDNVRASACFAIEHYNEGINFARSATAYLPNSPTAHRALLINLALDGKAGEANRVLQTVRHLAPKISPSWIKQNWIWAADKARKRYVEAFRIAGL